MGIIVMMGLGGLALAGLSLWARARSDGKVDLKVVDLALLAAPVLAWMFATGRIEKLNLFGLQVEKTREAIVGASTEPIEDQVVPVTLKDAVDLMDSGVKGAVSMIPELKRRRVEALEFTLGGGFYVATAIREHFEELAWDGDLEWVVIYDPDGGLHAVLPVVDLLRSFATLDFDESYMRLTDDLNDGGEQARQDLSELPGLVRGALAVTPETPKQQALETMEREDLDRLPVVDDSGRFIGMAERERLTASLILDVTRRLTR